MLDISSWTWGLVLIVLTTGIHSFGIALLTLLGMRIRFYLRGRDTHFWEAIGFMTMWVVVMGLSLAVLHGVEAAVWAGAYLSLGALDTPAEAMLFSVDSMTTRGASGLTLHHHWQVMGALEAVAGMLMFGISTAYNTCSLLCNLIGRRYRRGGSHACVGPPGRYRNAISARRTPQAAP
jgi:hypothetical protein